MGLCTLARLFQIGSSPQYAEAPKPGKSPVALIAVAAVVLLVIAGAGWFALQQGKAPAQTATNTIAPAAATPGTQTLVPVPTTTAPTATTTATATQTAVDPSLVDQEVQRRIAAERARLEAQTRAQQVATTQTAAPTRPAPVPTPAVTATQAPAPPPVQETIPAPAPVQPQSQPAEPEPVAAAPAPQPAAPRARQGDLIPVGTAGLTPPRLTRRGAVTYPPLARTQRVEGTVITTVLVSETGAVMEVRVVRGVSRSVGLNEAAVQAMRRSQFSPGTKDGVRVKSWVTVPVEFKL